jgi:hypothetical protein
MNISNRQLLEYFGKTTEELKAWATSDAIHPDDLPRVLSAFANSIATGTPYEMEHRWRQPVAYINGSKIRALPVRDADGPNHGLVRPAGRYRRPEARRQENTAERKQTCWRRRGSAIPEAWKHDVASGAAAITPEVVRMYGIQADEDASVAEFFFNRLHPDEPVWRQAMSRLD